MRRLLVVVVVASAVVLGRSPDPAGACTCEVRTIDEQVDAADVVLDGWVFASVPVDDPESASAAVRNTVAVGTVYAGEVDSEVVVFGGATSAGGCEYGFAEGRYLILAREEDDGLHTDVCSGTRPLADGESLHDELGWGDVPADVAARERQLDGRRRGLEQWEGRLISAVIGLAIGIGITRSRNRRARSGV